MVKDYVDWFGPYKQTLQWKAPFAMWFTGVKIDVVFSVFSAVAVRDRLQDSQPRILVACDGSYRRGKPLPLNHRLMK